MSTEPQGLLLQSELRDLLQEHLRELRDLVTQHEQGLSKFLQGFLTEASSRMKSPETAPDEHLEKLELEELETEELKQPPDSTSLDLDTLPTSPAPSGGVSRVISKNMRFLSQTSQTTEGAGKLKTFVLGPLDMCMGVVLVLNIAFIIWDAQCEGRNISASLGLDSPPSCMVEFAWIPQGFFGTCEYVFFVIYLLDVLVRAVALRGNWLFDDHGHLEFMNLLDAIVVVVNAIELFLMTLLVDLLHDQDSLANVKLLKLLRVTRTLRIVRTFTVLRQLRVLLLTCIASLGAFFWSIILLFLFQIAAALILNQMLHGYMMNSSEDVDGRKLVNEHYGDFLTALYSMFEITYSGSWPSLVRPILDAAGWRYAPFYLFYIMFVVFAVIRIITALFIKETLDCAAYDLELAIEEKHKQAESYGESLHALFFSMDANGDGTLSVAEMEAALENDVFAKYMDLLELRFKDVEPLFSLLDNDDGRLTVKEFCNGMTRIKGTARSYDLMQLLHDQNRLGKCCQDMQGQVNDVHKLVKQLVPGHLNLLRQSL